MLRAKHACADAASVVDRDRRDVSAVGAERGDGAQRVASRDRARGSTRAARRPSRDLGEDRRRRLLERDGAAENLADRVEEVDLLVAFGELVRGVLDLERGLQVLRTTGSMNRM